MYNYFEGEFLVKIFQKTLKKLFSDCFLKILPAAQKNRVFKMIWESSEKQWVPPYSFLNYVKCVRCFRLKKDFFLSYNYFNNAFSNGHFERFFQFINQILIINKTARISGQSSECSDCPLIHIEKFLGQEKNENL